MDIKNNIEKVRQNLPDAVTLVAVSKTQTPEIIKEAYNAGQRVFGENKVQELLEKVPLLPDDVQWHMIGHLQTNKVKYLASHVHLIHSVDSFKLLFEINKQGNKLERVIPCLLQIHIAEEESKYGFSEQEVMQLINESQLDSLTHTSIVGLMGMATFTNNQKQIRSEFKKLKHFFEHLKELELPKHMEMRELSMGMSGDYRIAIEEGSTMVRVGSLIFGERN